MVATMVAMLGIETAPDKIPIALVPTSRAPSAVKIGRPTATTDPKATASTRAARRIG